MFKAARIMVVAIGLVAAGCSDPGGGKTPQDASVSRDAATDAALDAHVPAHAIGGTVTGLVAGTVTLQNNAGDDLPVAVSGSFTFATPIAEGQTYAVTVKTQPPGQQCTVTGGTGTVSTASVSSVAVTCADTLTCPVGTSGTKRTVCGRLYDLVDNAPIQADTACTACASATSTGPCSLTVTAYDAVALATNPGTATPLPTSATYIDTCGRFRLTDVSTGGSATTVLVIDDSATSGTGGTTVPTAVAVQATGGTALPNVEAFAASATTVASWESSGGPAVSSGIFTAIFRAHVAATPAVDPFATQSGVSVTKAGTAIAASDYYFNAGATTRTTIDTSATATGANGTALVTGAAITDGSVYSGSGGLSDTVNCQWSAASGAALPSFVWVQVFRPVSAPTKTCAL